MSDTKQVMFNFDKLNDIVKNTTYKLNDRITNSLSIIDSDTYFISKEDLKNQYLETIFLECKTFLYLTLNNIFDKKKITLIINGDLNDKTKHISIIHQQLCNHLPISSKL